MSRFETGYTYIVYDPNKLLWYLVQQIGAKSWVATNFTHLTLAYARRIVKGNGVGLYNELGVDRDDGYIRTTNQRQLRMALFNILKYGSIDVPM